MSRGEPDIKIVDCGYCGGSGVEGRDACPACGGGGRHKFRLRYDERLERCRPCNGGGALGVSLCSRCNGSGWDVI